MFDNIYNDSSEYPSFNSLIDLHCSKKLLFKKGRM